MELDLLCSFATDTGYIFSYWKIWPYSTVSSMKSYSSLINMVTNSTDIKYYVKYTYAFLLFLILNYFIYVK